MNNRPHSYSVRFGPNSAVFERPGSSSAVVATILGRTESSGRERVYLDRLIGGPEAEVEGWTCEGAVTSILDRIRPDSDSVRAVAGESGDGHREVAHQTGFIPVETTPRFPGGSTGG